MRKHAGRRKILRDQDVPKLTPHLWSGKVHTDSVLRNFARRRGDTERSFRFGLPERHAADANENM